MQRLHSCGRLNAPRAPVQTCDARALIAEPPQLHARAHDSPSGDDSASVSSGASEPLQQTDGAASRTAARVLGSTASEWARLFFAPFFWREGVWRVHSLTLTRAGVAFGGWEAHTSGIGSKLLAAMGYMPVRALNSACWNIHRCVRHRAKA